METERLKFISLLKQKLLSVKKLSFLTLGNGFALF